VNKSNSKRSNPSSRRDNIVSIPEQQSEEDLVSETKVVKAVSFIKQDTHKSLKNSESQKERRGDEESKRSVPSKRTSKKYSPVNSNPAPSVAKSIKSPNQSARRSPSTVSKVSKHESIKESNKPPLSPLQSDYMPTPEKRKEEPAEEQFNQYGDVDEQ